MPDRRNTEAAKGSIGVALVMLLKTAKFAKPLLTFGTFVLSVFAYSFSLGFMFALAFVTMLMVHELGHVAALKTKGIKASLPVFIPFVGAAVFTPRFQKLKDEAYVALAGPVVGSLGAFAVLAVALALPSHPEFLIMLAYTAILINAFNLLPIPPLDGGRVAKMAGPWAGRIALVAIAVAVLALKSPVIVVLAIVVLGEVPISWARRIITGIVLETWLLFMAAYGIGGPQPWWGYAIGFTVATAFNCLMIHEYRREKEWARLGVADPADEADNAAQELSKNERLTWLGVWAGLAGILVYLLIWMHPMLPAAAR